MHRKTIKKDLHIVIKSISDLLAEEPVNDKDSNKEFIQISNENAEKIIQKLTTIEELLRQLAEQTEFASAFLEAELQSNKSLNQGIKRQHIELEETAVQTQTSLPPSPIPIRSEEKFPLHSIQKVIDLNNLMATDENVSKTVENFLRSHQECVKQNFTKALNLFIDDEALFEVSWTGQKDSFAFCSLINVTDALWRIWFQSCNLQDFERAIKFELTKAQSRLFQIRFRKLKAKRASKD